MAENKKIEVYRIQDAQDHGPWKPGFYHQWVEDREDHDNLKPFFIEFGQTVFDSAILGMFLGSACESLEQLRRWFTPSEYAKLRSLGYHAVKMEVGRLLASSPIQCVLERSKPLSRDVIKVELYPHEETRVKNEGISQLIRIEEYLDMMSHEASKEMLFTGNNGELYYWYEDALDFVADIVDNVPMVVLKFGEAK